MYDNKNYIPHANAFLTALLGIIAFILMCVFIPLLAFRPANVGDMVRNSDVSRVLKETGMSNEIVDAINELPFIETQIETGDIEDFLQNAAVSNEIGKVMDDYAKALAQGDLDHHLTAADIVDIAKTLSPEVEEYFNYHMTEADYKELEVALDNTVEFNELRAGNILDEFDVDVPEPVLFVSVYLVWGVGILSAVIILLIFVHHRGWIADGFHAAGLPVMLSGILYFLIGLLFGTYPELLYGILYEMTGFITGPAFLVMKYGIAFAALGILSIIIGSLLNRRAA